MKISLRRPGAPAADPTASDVEPAPPPKPPRGRPVAAYAAVLDGSHLWLAVDAAPGTLALREAATGEVVTLTGDHEDSPTYRSVRADLLALPGTGETSYDAVLVPPGGRSPKPVWTPPLPEPAATVVPPAGDGTRFALQRAEDGTLRLLRRPDELLPELVGLSATVDSVEVHVVGAIGGELHLRRDDEVLVTLPLIDGRATIGLDDLPADPPKVLRVTVGTAAEARLVRRARNDLADPNRAVLLPQLFTPDSDMPRMRLAWTPRGTLNVRVPEGRDA